MAEAHNSMAVISSRQNAVVAKQHLTLELLEREDDVTSNTVIECFRLVREFVEESKKVTDEIMQRDLEDAQKLQKGIDLAISKGVLPQIEPPEYNVINVLEKSADEVADTILGGCDVNKGCVIVLCGLSGTGKGTTVKKIRDKVKNSLTWSNGNVFRSLTLLTKAYADKNDKTVQQVVEEEGVLGKLMESLTFAEFEGKGWDTKIENEELGIGPLYVNEVKNTVLKAKDVATNIPTVAEQSQALVVKYVDSAVKQLGEAGFTVLVEGREATVNYVNTPYRFQLMLEDTSIIGQRRMAQRMVATATKNISAEDGDDYEKCYEALKDALVKMSRQS